MTIQLWIKSSVKEKIQHKIKNMLKFPQKTVIMEGKDTAILMF